MRGVMQKLLLAVALLSLVAACVVVQPPTRVSRGPGWYTVKKSDTLYSIAWRYGLDYKELAQWNGIDVTAPIFPGQRLRLIDPGGAVIAQTRRERRDEVTPRGGSGSASEPETRSADAGSGTESTQFRDPSAWLWPTEGVPLNTFHPVILDRRGIDIGGKLGQPVRAVADGRVVYSGNGLAGYGNLIIIKHSDNYLSAYAYCQERLVKEGTAVTAGTMVARMGRKDNTAKLYFEIRRNGKPVDPMKFLPAR